MSRILRDVAHVRTGDKGDISQIAVIALREEDYPLLLSSVTPERVGGHLAGLNARLIRRYELPMLGAVNLVLEGALRGGVTRSLALDAHGKTLGAQLLDLPLIVE
ncbi:hypothetical protein EOE18_07335 [Novosphingobium umbonatum]|uniref:AtuA-like ferredoxin-fold domain-containing protein n=1 Tax=Novosphingobium umbonatum TaxID=1908524 RepID=A0A437N765_9SPHN|nr:hypothetical protein [Novosphingobium umbonatum]RVU05786.1 hypothetical protein EOE18_07335 [Novosphingobium umbonatum]